MNTSKLDPRSFSTDQLRAALADVGGPARPDYLPDIVAQAGRMRQLPAWTFLGGWLASDTAVRRRGVARVAVLFAVLSLLVALLVAGGVYIGSQRTQPDRSLALPTTPDAWQRVVIDAGRNDAVGAVAAGPRGLLAAAGEGEESRLYFSSDGHDWTRVPADQHGPVGQHGAALVATDHGFLLVGNEVAVSEDGLSWRRIASPAEDVDLRAGTPIAAAPGGPGLVAVGTNNMAWYSTDGTDWTLAEVPPPPGEPSQLAGPLDQASIQGVVEMIGVAGAGRSLVAWGTSKWVHDDGSRTFIPVLWASSDGVTWTNVPAPDRTHYATVTGGPRGFALVEQAGGGPAWLSTDGTSWERVADDAFGPSRWPGLRNDDGIPVEMYGPSIAAGVAGYIAAGYDGLCLLDCSSSETVIWTSPDGRSWSRLPDDDVFQAPTGAGALVAVAWGSDFVVGGEYDGNPAIWISRPDATGG